MMQAIWNSALIAEAATERGVVDEFFKRRRELQRAVGRPDREERDGERSAGQHSGAAEPHAVRGDVSQAEDPCVGVPAQPLERGHGGDPSGLAEPVLLHRQHPDVRG